MEIIIADVVTPLKIVGLSAKRPMLRNVFLISAKALP